MSKNFFTGIKKDMRFITTKPIKEFPQRLIYAHHDNINTMYKMADTKTGEYVGEMLSKMSREITPSIYYPSIYPYNSFYIKLLRVNKKRQGHGTAFIKLAQAESKRNGGNGRVHLKASNCFDEEHPAHIFYRKLGFDSQYTETLDLVDEAIKKHKKLSKNIPDITMYLPKNPKPVKYEPTLLEKFKNSFKKK